MGDFNDNLARAEALAALEEARRHVEECPECGEGIEGVALSLDGTFVFAHAENDDGAITDGCPVDPGDVPGVEL